MIKFGKGIWAVNIFQILCFFILLGLLLGLHPFFFFVILGYLIWFIVENIKFWFDRIFWKDRNIKIIAVFFSVILMVQLLFFLFRVPMHTGFSWERIYVYDGLEDLIIGGLGIVFVASILLKNKFKKEKMNDKN